MTAVTLEGPGSNTTSQLRAERSRRQLQHLRGHLVAGNRSSHTHTACEGAVPRRLARASSSTPARTRHRGYERSLHLLPFAQLAVGMLAAPPALQCNASVPVRKGRHQKRAKNTVQINNNYFSNITQSIIFSRGSGLRIVGREGTRALKGKNADSQPEFSLARWRFGAVRL